MAGYGHDRFGMSFIGLDSLVELNRMTIRPPVLVEYHHIGSFDEGPLEVMINVGRVLPKRVFPPLELTRGTVPA